MKVFISTKTAFMSTMLNAFTTPSAVAMADVKPVADHQVSISGYMKPVLNAENSTSTTVVWYTPR